MRMDQGEGMVGCVWWVTHTRIDRSRKKNTSITLENYWGC